MAWCVQYNFCYLVCCVCWIRGESAGIFSVQRVGYNECRHVWKRAIGLADIYIYI